MSEPARRRATYDDLLRVPDTKVAELIDGELIVSPRPAGPHAVASSVLGRDLAGAFHRGGAGGGGRPGGWWILDEPELHLGGDVLVPDLAGWRRSRLPQYPQTTGVTVAPDWVCEILSPSTRRHDRLRKLHIYARERVGHAWLVDPDPQTLEVFRREGGLWLLLGTHAGDERVRAEPFEAFELALADLWDLGDDPTGGETAAP